MRRCTDLCTHHAFYHQTRWQLRDTADVAVSFFSGYVNISWQHRRTSTFHSRTKAIYRDGFCHFEGKWYNVHLQRYHMYEICSSCVFWQMVERAAILHSVSVTRPVPLEIALELDWLMFCVAGLGQTQHFISLLGANNVDCDCLNVGLHVDSLAVFWCNTFSYQGHASCPFGSSVGWIM